METPPPGRRVNEEPMFPGYKLLDDGILQPSFNENGIISNPDVLAIPNLLCATCEAIVRGAMAWLADKTPFRPVRFHSGAESFRQSVMQGCHLCALLWAISVSYYHQHGTEDQINECIRLLSSSTIVCNSYTFSLKLVRSDGSVTPYLSCYPSGLIKPPSDLQFRAKLSATNASEATYQTASSWLDKCVEEHEECSDRQTWITRPPTRLIDIGDHPQSNLRIIEPDQIVRWIAVSHCWGKFHEGTLKLKESNLQDLKGGFLKEDLPQLFRDCVEVCRRLKCRYLWIDSLCIIQDSKKDWSEESKRMGDVYQGSYLTIAAVSAVGNHESLFTKAHPLMLESYSPKHLLTFEETGREHWWDIQPPNQPAELLYSRAWVLQERLLASRTLEFTKGGIRWHCAQINLLRLQDEIDGGPAFGLAWHWKFLLALQSDTLSAYERIRGQDSWTTILNAYNATDLTFETDRPIAIRGIISTLEEEAGLTIVAGMVSEFLPRSLLWRVPDDGKLPLERGKYHNYRTWKSSLDISPSWSCAFRHRYINAIGRRLSGFTSAETTLIAGAKPTLCIKGNYIGSVFIEPMLERNKIGVSFACAAYSKVILQQHKSRYISLEDFVPHFGLILSLDFILEGRIECEFVLISVLEEEAPLRRVAGHGLVLMKSGPNDTCWERIGVFSMPGPSVEAGRLLLEFYEERGFMVY